MKILQVHNVSIHCFFFYLSRSLDPQQTGKIDENHFRKMMKSKEAIPEQDIEDMLEGR